MDMANIGIIMEEFFIQDKNIIIYLPNRKNRLLLQKKKL
jgi:hypothetical protein